MYPEFLATARRERQIEAVRSFNFAGREHEFFTALEYRDDTDPDDAIDDEGRATMTGPVAYCFAGYY